MNTPAKMTVLLFVATLGMQAQTTASPSDQQTEEQRRRQQNTSASPSPSSPSSSQSSSQTPGQSSSAYGQANSQRDKDQDKDKDKQNQNRYSQNPSSSTSSSQSQSGDARYSSNQPSDVQRQNQNASTTQGSQTATAQTGSQSQTGVQSNTSSTSQTNVAVNTQADAEVRTVVQQIDAQGPVVVERISTRFADVTCTEENARALVEALHSGTSVTLRGDDGQTATFTPTAHLGYGEAYIAMAMAVEALKQAGINGCATPAQWQAVLMGGQLSGGTVTTAYSTERFPGILVLHEQGGWTKVAQTTNIQLNQVVSQANTNLQLNNTSTTASTTSTSGQDNLSPTGFERGHDPRAADKSGKKDDDKSKDKKDHEDHGLKTGQDEKKASDMETPPKSTPPKY